MVKQRVGKISETDSSETPVSELSVSDVPRSQLFGGIMEIGNCGVAKNVAVDRLAVI